MADAESVLPALKPCTSYICGLDVHAHGLVPAREVRLEVVVKHRGSSCQLAGLVALME